MKHSHKIIAITMGLVLLAGNLAGQAGANFMIRGGAVVPDRSDEWEVGGGLDVGIAVWPSPNVGLWLGGGVQGWTMEKEAFPLDSGGWGLIEGDVALVPFGASILLWGDMGNGIALQAEGGLRYAVADADARIWAEYPYSREYNELFRYEIDIDNTVLAVASMQLEFDLNPLVLGIGAGFQWDLREPKQKLYRESFAKTSFSAALFFMTLGVAF